ncbi:MAG: hypothetical protein RIS76_182 [Verrucomicrobiota bacterium]|jgi:Protein of unknown function (DUF3106)
MIRKPVILLTLLLIAGATETATAAQESPRNTNRVKLPLPPPLPPTRKSPTDLFRELLATSPAERATLLANRPAASRELITSKLREFEALPPDQRELRLRVAELQFYLSPLLRSTPETRLRQLSGTPAEVRPLLLERLQAWDTLSEDRRRDVLDSEQSLSFFVRLQVTDPAALERALREVPSTRRAEVESQLARWRGLSPEVRAQKTADFQRFFELRSGEQEKVLRMISSVERVQMERTLERFHDLPPDQRERAVRGFGRFIEMTAPERAEFLQNAAKWQGMTPSEREAWRRVVERATHLMPFPMPPDRPRNRGLAMTNSVGQ